MTDLHRCPTIRISRVALGFAHKGQQGTMGGWFNNIKALLRTPSVAA
jgi:hypothetical protein